MVSEVQKNAANTISYFCVYVMCDNRFSFMRLFTVVLCVVKLSWV